MTKYFLPIAFLIFTGPFCYSQPGILDSLQSVFNNTTNDTIHLRLYLELGAACDIKDNLNYAAPALQLAEKLLSQTADKNIRDRIMHQKADAYNLIAFFYSSGSMADPKKVIEYNEKILDTYREIRDTVNMIDLYRLLSFYHLSMGNLQNSIQHIQQALNLSREAKNKKSIAGCLFQMADLYRDYEENTQALENYQNALTLLYEIKDTSELINVIAGMGGFYYKIHNIEKSLECYNKVISLYKERKWNDKICEVYKWIGDLYKDNKDYDNSLLNYAKSLSMYEAIYNKDKIKDLLNEIGIVYNLQGEITKAIEHHNKALAISEEIKSENGIAWSRYCLASAYYNENEYTSAKKHIEPALTVLKKQTEISITRDAELLASEIDSATGNGIGAYQHFKEYTRLNNKLKGEEVHKTAQLEKYENDRVREKAIAKAQQEKKDAIAAAELKQEQMKRTALYGGVALLMIFGGVMTNRFRVTQKQKKVIEMQKAAVEKEKQRSDELLLNILPSEVAEELKETGSAKAKRFDNVTVLFTDFKNFTQASEKLSAEGLVKEINYCYSEFDKIITKYGIEKIKTIGDSYMCAGGLPTTNETHPWDVVKAGLELQQFIIKHKEERIRVHQSYFELRLGIHTGPVVAGIVGIKKFAYDIWGDTVNTASRMESSGEVGAVNISGTTYELVKDKFQCVYRGKVAAKNKGEIAMYFVIRSSGA